MVKASRKYRRNTRRKGSRRSNRRCWSRRQRGGQAPVNDTSMQSAGAQSLAQGRDYAQIHRAQHGGGAAVALASSAPVGYTGVLDESLRAAARITPIDNALGAIRGMSDQSGGARRRRRASRRGMKVMSIKTAMKSYIRYLKRMSRKMRGRKMRGGAGSQVGPVADYGSPGMLLSPAQEARALMGMNPEWKLAADPTSFAPKMAA